MLAGPLYGRTSCRLYLANMLDFELWKSRLAFRLKSTG